MLVLVRLRRFARTRQCARTAINTRHINYKCQESRPRSRPLVSKHGDLYRGSTWDQSRHRTDCATDNIYINIPFASTQHGFGSAGNDHSYEKINSLSIIYQIYTFIS